MAVTYCRKCVTPNTWPDAIFDNEGICLPCRYNETFGQIDWDARRAELREITEWGRKHRRGNYDCIIGVSGGKDSTRQAFFARDDLGLKPLLVSCVYPPEQQTQRGADNLSNLVEQGFDLHMVGPAPQVSKKLTRYSFEKFVNIFKASELVLYASLPRVAIAYGIPLIFLGENPALAFGGNVGSQSSDGNQQRQHNTLSGGKLDAWLNAGIKQNELNWYQYPSERDFDRAGLRIVYLGYYMDDFHEIANAAFAMAHGLKIRTGVDALPEETGSLNPYEALDDEFVHVNQMLKYLKLGFGKVVQHASVRVRLGEMSRDEAIDAVNRYDGKCSTRYIDKFCHYVDIPKEHFDEIADVARNKDLWQLNNHGEWELRYKLAPVTSLD
ncbi:MAG: N-acetyl sugar amidotransferase [Rhodospirillaceae bacterium]|nr:MAG: N-acetyl sugar amidotransferase [Rhodospirillaceae bacterium]